MKSVYHLNPFLMAAVTYLFGAGASCECLPLVKNIPERLEVLRALLDGYNPPNLHENYKRPGQKKVDIKNQINAALKNLISKVKVHASIDTYAKKLALTRDSDYSQVKLLLSFSFIYDQMVNPPDRRYDAFFASIMKTDILSFLDIKILSWNYDYQFEKSFSGFINENSLRRIQTMLNVVPFDADVRESKDFTILKLNGTTAFRNRNDVFNSLDDLSSNNVLGFIEKLFEYYDEIKDPSTLLRSMMGFAWEGYDLTKKIMTEAKRDIDKSKAIVVVGYSFPFFNRDIDRDIFATVNKDVKIYVQDTNPEMVINNLISVLPPDREFKFKPTPIHVDPQIGIPIDKKDIVQFYLPAEL